MIGKSGFDERKEFAEINRLDQMVMKSRLFRASSVFLLAITGSGDNDGVGATLRLTQPPGDLIAIHSPDANIEQDHVGPVRHGKIDGIRSGVSYGYFMPIQPKKPRHT